MGLQLADRSGVGRFRLPSMLASAIVTLLLASPAGAHAPGTSPDFFGINGAYLRDFVNPDQAATLEGLAASMGEQGISWARITFDQAVDEPYPGYFNWYAEDRMVSALARHGVRGAASFVGTAYWASDPRHVPECGPMAAPKDLAGWSEWVAAAARRYGENGTFWRAHPELPELPIRIWEIGNEVNSKIFWCPGANPERYAAVYSASADAIRAVDPSAKVIVAGLAPRFGWQNEVDLDVPTFLNRMIAADPSLRTRIPAVAIHPYAGSVEGVLGGVYMFRMSMIGAGMPDTPMLANEFGWYTEGDPDTQGHPATLKATESQRAELIGGVANRLWRTDCGLMGAAPYSWITLERNPADPEHWFGLADAQTGAPHPSGIAYGDQIKLALGQTPSPPPSSTSSLCGSTEEPGPSPAPAPNMSPPPQVSAPAGKPGAKKKQRKRKKRRKARLGGSVR